MFIPVTHFLKTSSFVMDPEYWRNKIYNNFKISIDTDGDTKDAGWIYRKIFFILNKLPFDFKKDFNISRIIISTKLGPNRPYYPNHGYFKDDMIVLNINIFREPDYPADFYSTKGYFLPRPEQTIYHELAHAFDHAHGNLSTQDNWMKLSGWSYVWKPGLKRLVIKEPNTPTVIGEMFYNPKAKFTRFYAKRNSWDDFADAFSFYVSDQLREELKRRAPEKYQYFNKLLEGYYGKIIKHI